MTESVFFLYEWFLTVVVSQARNSQYCSKCNVLLSVYLPHGYSTNIMATGGLTTALPAADGATTTDSDASPEAPWSSTAGAEYKARIWEDFQDLFQEDHLTDVILIADGKSIPCHRVLLAAASKFFRDMFVASSTNPRPLESNLIYIEGVDFDILRAIVSFVYNGSVELTVENTELLIPASVSLLLPELTKLCKDFLHYKVDHDTSACIDIHRIAKTNGLTDITDKARQVMLEKFQYVSQVEAFKEMCLTDLLEYIGDERLNVRNENSVFEAAVIWVRHDLKNRKFRFESLLEKVELSCCSQLFLEDVVRKEPLMHTGKCFQHLSDALNHHVVTPRLSGTARAGYYNTLLAMYDDYSYTLKLGESEWVKQTSIFKRFSRSSACMTADGILVSGGWSGCDIRACEKFTLPNMEMTTMPDLNARRSYHASVCVGDRIYVLGGYESRYSDGSGESLQSVEYLDVQDESWNFTCEMPSGLSGHTAVSYKHFIYVFGGSRKSQASFMLDTVRNEWSRKADIPSVCYKWASVVYRDRIYVLGAKQNCCMSYDPDQDQWKTDHSQPAVFHDGPSAVVWKDRILLCGGWNTSVIEEYDTDTWAEWKTELSKYAKAQCPPTVFAVHI